MVKHTIEVSARPAYIKLRHKQLMISSGEGDAKVEKSYACEDIGVLILQHPGILVTSAVLNELVTHGCVVIFCDHRHMPSGMLLPTVTHTELVPRLQNQLKASLPDQKRTWQKIVQFKIKAQAENIKNLTSSEIVYKKLKVLSTKVKSGDTENHEAQAAKLYWSCLFADRYAKKDNRLPESNSFYNSCLNYGYAIMRAVVARAIVSSGLQPALGVFHHNRGNPFCLADDIMEPLRPIVDAKVREIVDNADLSKSLELERVHKSELLNLLTLKVEYDNFQGPLMVAISRYTSGFYHYLIKERSSWTYPKMLKLSEDVH